METKKENYHGKAISRPLGKAAEYSAWACNLYNGCSHNCSYCYNNHSLMSATLGGTMVRLKAFDCWFDDEKDFFKNLDQRVSVLASDHVFIIDNVTSILPSNLTAKRAKKFYRHLKKVQAECEERGFRITFIVIAHTVKDFKNPITLKDLAGAGELSALSNRVIVIWPTKWGEKTKGLQVLKNRDSVKGDVKVLNLLETPYAHFEYDRTITMQEAIEASYQSEIDRFLKGFINMGTSNGKPGRLNDNEKAELYRNVKKFLNQGPFVFLNILSSRYTRPEQH